MSYGNSNIHIFNVSSFQNYERGVAAEGCNARVEAAAEAAEIEDGNMSGLISVPG